MTPSSSSSTSAPSTRGSPRGRVFDLEVLSERSGFCVLRVRGRGARARFAHESGGHRWQRVSPTEKRGRVHTSTVTVVVLDEPDERALVIDPSELEESFVRGSGPGGQHRNTSATAVILKHLPSGLQVRVDGGRSQHLNRVAALELLRAKLAAQRRDEGLATRADLRRRLGGTGMRGDKIRTIQVRNGVVVDHARGTRMSYQRYERGFLEELER